MATQARPDILGRDDYPYIPPAQLRIDESLKLHRSRRARRPNHARGDPACDVEHQHRAGQHDDEDIRLADRAYGHDFNPSILDERGDFVFFGPFLQYLSSASGSAVKWTLEIPVGRTPESATATSS